MADGCEESECYISAKRPRLESVDEIEHDFLPTNTTPLVSTSVNLSGSYLNASFNGFKCAPKISQDGGRLWILSTNRRTCDLLLFNSIS